MRAPDSGNILANGRVGLLFIDFCTGDTLHISGKQPVVLALNMTTS